MVISGVSPTSTPGSVKSVAVDTRAAHEAEEWDDTKPPLLAVGNDVVVEPKPNHSVVCLLFAICMPVAAMGAT